MDYIAIIVLIVIIFFSSYIINLSELFQDNGWLIGFILIYFLYNGINFLYLLVLVVAWMFFNDQYQPYIINFKNNIVQLFQKNNNMNISDIEKTHNIIYNDDNDDRNSEKH